MAHGRKKCPREGTRLKYEPSPVSHAMYTRPPMPGEVGTVVSLPLPGAGRKTCTGSHSQDLVYVNWPSIGTMGVARADVEKVKGRGPKQMQVNGALADRIYAYAIGQRVIVRGLGPGHVTMKRGIHLGVKLDSGAFTYAHVSSVEPTGERQRFSGPKDVQYESVGEHMTLGGLGLPAERHVDKAQYFQEHALNAAQEAEKHLANNDCLSAFQHLVDAIQDDRTAATHVRAANGNAMATPGLHTTLIEFRKKCVKRDARTLGGVGVWMEGQQKIRLTYGTLPDFETFERHFGKGTFPIHHGSSGRGRIRPAEGNYTARELYAELQNLVSYEDDEASSWVSSILSTLGFEWV